MDTTELYDFLVGNHRELRDCIDKVENQCDERFKDTIETRSVIKQDIAVLTQRFCAAEKKAEDVDKKCTQCKKDFFSSLEKKQDDSSAPPPETKDSAGVNYMAIIGGALVLLNSLGIAVILIWLKSGSP